jgi:hypothetical protein
VGDTTSDAKRAYEVTVATDASAYDARDVVSGTVTVNRVGAMKAKVPFVRLRFTKFPRSFSNRFAPARTAFPNTTRRRTRLRLFRASTARSRVRRGIAGGVSFSNARRSRTRRPSGGTSFSIVSGARTSPPPRTQRRYLDESAPTANPACAAPWRTATTSPASSGVRTRVRSISRRTPRARALSKEARRS